jgi:hypothetical protein
MNAIVVEGIDGSGKTSLVKRLAESLNVPIHPRFAHSITGPRSELFDWARQDVDMMHYHPLCLYDRHPLVSAFVYGPVLGHPANLDQRFHTSEGMRVSRAFANQVMVIFCDPGIKEVAKNLTTEDAMNTQMPGVLPHWQNLYHAYRSLMHYWPGHVVVWDYRFLSLYDSLVSQCIEFISVERNAHA